MKISTGKVTPVQLQIVIWSVIILTNFLTMLPMDGFAESLAFTLISASFNAIVIYGNIFLLLPKLYDRHHRVGYIIVALLLLATLGYSRAWLSHTIYNQWFAPKQTLLRTPDILYVITAGFAVFILSFVVRIALAYFTLKQQAQQMLEQKSIAELNLLKSQVQPHFLFNTLNNIYYEAFRESPRTALLIGRLSDIMRYFVDDSPRENVSLSTEIRFLENYIALEKIRIRHGVQVLFSRQTESDHSIPPMLLMTFVENIFKHGVDRSGADNKVTISLTEEEGYLHFQTSNALLPPDNNTHQKGFGLKNLQKRLTLLYGDNFELMTRRTDHSFLASLKIPLR